MIQPSIFREVNIPIKMTCLKNQPPVVTMKRPVIAEYAMAVHDCGDQKKNETLRIFALYHKEIFIIE